MQKKWIVGVAIALVCLGCCVPGLGQIEMNTPFLNRKTAPVKTGLSPSRKFPSNWKREVMVLPIAKEIQ